MTGRLVELLMPPTHGGVERIDDAVAVDVGAHSVTSPEIWSTRSTLRFRGLTRETPVRHRQNAEVVKRSTLISYLYTIEQLFSLSSSCLLWLQYKIGVDGLTNRDIPAAMWRFFWSTLFFRGLTTLDHSARLTRRFMSAPRTPSGGSHTVRSHGRRHGPASLWTSTTARNTSDRLSASARRS